MNFDKKICLFHVTAENQKEALNILANEFYRNDVVNDNFLEGILQREVVFPTGLLLEDGTGVAIPHTDGDKVKRSQIGYMSLEKPVIFKEMGQDDHEIEVRQIFMLALKEAHEQLTTLQNLMTIFCDTKLMNDLYACESQEKYEEIIHNAGLE